MDERLTITEVAKSVGVTQRTIMRWEKAGKIKKSKRDWRGWRFYFKDDLASIKEFYETAYEYDEENGAMISLSKKMVAMLIIGSLALFGLVGLAWAEATVGVAETTSSVDITLGQLPVMGTADAPVSEAVKYTLGPNDVIAIEVRRHPEFSGKYAINSEGKIEYKFVGDIIIEGMTKAQLKDRLTELVSEFVIQPEIDVQILEYLSKVFYVVGELNRPGKFYMRGNTVSVREALVQAGLPALTASLRKANLITPNADGQNNAINIDVEKLLYKGDLSQNLEMQPGDVLYVPPTAMTKIIRVISPPASIVGQVTGTARAGMGMGF